MPLIQTLTYTPMAPVPILLLKASTHVPVIGPDALWAYNFGQLYLPTARNTINPGMLRQAHTLAGEGQTSCLILSEYGCTDSALRNNLSKLN